MTVEVVPLKYLVGINERSLPEDTDPDRQIRYVDISSVGRGELVAKPSEMRFADAPSRARRLVKPGDTIISTVRTYLRAVWPVSGNTDDLVVSTGFAVLTPRSVDPPYFSWWVRSDVFIEEVVARSVGVSYPAINATELGELRVRIPSAEKQRAIVDFLETETARIDALISKKRALVDKVEARWRAELLARLAVADEPLLSTMPWLPDPLPHGWAVVPLKRLTPRSWGGDWGEEPGVAELDLPCVRAADFAFSDLRAVSGAPRSFGRATVASRLLRPGDLVIEKSGGGEGVPVGRVVAWQGDAAAVPTNFAGGLRPGTGMDPNFVLLVFRAAYEIGLPWRSIKQTTGLQNLDVGHYLAHPWAVPPVEIQRRIADELLQALTRARHVQARLRHQIRLLQEHRQALITAAVTSEAEGPGVAT